MDIYCPRCGEPWDIDSVYDEGRYLKLSPSKSRARFASDGCGMFGTRCTADPGNARAAAMAAMLDVMGDDFDGIASTIDDFGYLGMLD